MWKRLWAWRPIQKIGIHHGNLQQQEKVFPPPLETLPPKGVICTQLVSNVNPTHFLVVLIHNQRLCNLRVVTAFICFPTSRVDRGDHYSWFPFVPPSQYQLSTIPPCPLLSPLKPKLLIPNLFWKMLPILNQCTRIPSLSCLQLLYQRDTSIKPVSEDVMTLIEIFFRNSHHNLGREGEISSAVRKICSCLPSCVWDNVKDIPRSTISKDKSLQAPLCGLQWTILTETNPALKSNHCLIHWKLTCRIKSTPETYQQVLEERLDFCQSRLCCCCGRGRWSIQNISSNRFLESTSWKKGMLLSQAVFQYISSSGTWMMPIFTTTASTFFSSSNVVSFHLLHLDFSLSLPVLLISSILLLAYSFVPSTSICRSASSTNRLVKTHEAQSHCLKWLLVLAAGWMEIQLVFHLLPWWLFHSNHHLSQHLRCSLCLYVLVLVLVAFVLGVIVLVLVLVLVFVIVLVHGSVVYVLVLAILG